MRVKRCALVYADYASVNVELSGTHRVNFNTLLRTLIPAWFEFEVIYEPSALRTLLAAEE